MYRSPDSRASPRVPRHQIPEGPIHDFTTIVETTAPDEWQKRTAALHTLVATIPSGSDYYGGGLGSFPSGDSSDNQEGLWYNSPPVLRHLAIPLSELLKDPRTTVVKRTTESCTELFAKCQVDARYLLKDIMPAIIQVQGSTVAVIRNYIDAMVMEAIAVVPCKMTMPLWLDRLKHDKSRTVREACCLYLTKGMEEWSSLMGEGYLTRDIYNQVGTALINALRDASPNVRQQARKGLEIFNGLQPDVFDRLVANDVELTSDLRVKKLLQRMQAGEAVGDDVSVASRVSRVSVYSAPVRGFPAGQRGNGATTTPSRFPGLPTSRRRGMGSGVSSSGYAKNRTKAAAVIGGGDPPTIIISSSDGIPTTIGVLASPPRSRGLGPPRRIAASTSIDTNEKSTNGTITPADSPLSQTPPLPFQIAVDETPLEPDLPNRSTALSPEDPNQSFDTTVTDVSELQPITSTTELRQVAKSRGLNSRRSSLLQDRLMRSSSNIIPEGTEHDTSSTSQRGDDVAKIAATNANSVVSTIVDMAHLGPDEIANHPNLPEHTKVAHQLLEAHKVHVDQVMEVLKVEMDALKDFELILLEEGPRRPTEEEVLEYFESLGLCLEQRTKAGQILQKKMDRISQGT